MKRFNIFLLAIALCFALGTVAQAQTTTNHDQVVAPKFGYLNTDSLLRTLPEYAQVEADMQQLRAKYKAETEYNEQDFRRKYAEYLQGQKTFTENIMVKRQIDLQLTLERGIAYRNEADSLLHATHEEMLYPLRMKLARAINAVGFEHNLDFIINTASGSYSFVNPLKAINITEMVKEKFFKNNK